MKETTKSKSSKTKSQEDLEFRNDYMKIKKKKLEDQFKKNIPLEKPASTSKDINNLFAGISIFVNGYTEPSSMELKRLMMVYGGTYYHYYNKSKCKYIIATSLAQSKIKALKDEKIIHPNWVVDSINAGRLLDIHSYLLFNEMQREANILKFTKLTTSSVIRDISSQNNSTIIEEGVHERPSSSSKNNVCATNNDFLSEFYNNSRLHHISNSSAELKRYVSSLQSRGSEHFSGIDKLKCLPNNGRFILEKLEQVYMHVDMDCFFVSVGLRNHSHLIGKPVVVAHSSGNQPRVRDGMSLEYEAEFFQKLNQVSEKGKPEAKTVGSGYPSFSEIACCSYEARNFGVKNGMFLGPALKLCPNLQVIPYDFKSYTEVSYLLYDTVASYTHDIEAVSCDEMFVDCTKIIAETGLSPLEFANHLRSEIKSLTGCNATAGLGHNLLLARLATRKAKPNGSYHIRPGEQDFYMMDINIKSLPGVGRSLESRLLALGIETCGALKSLQLNFLRKEFGQKTGDNLFKFARGICNRRLQLSHERKSVSADVNYGIRFKKDEEATKFIKDLSAEVSNRLREIKAMGKSVTLKLKVRKANAPVETSKFMGHGICDNLTRSTALVELTNCPTILFKKSILLLQSVNVPVQDLRGIGIQVQKLSFSEDSESLNKKPNTLHDMFKRMNEQSSTIEATTNEKLPQLKNESASTSDDLHQTNKNTNDFYPSQLSNVDQSILQQLPSDIKKQIMDSYDTEASSSKAEVLNSDDTSNQQPLSELPDISSIDKAVFSALPSEIQLELQAAYSQNKKIKMGVTKQKSPSLKNAVGTKKNYKNNHLNSRKLKFRPQKNNFGVKKITDHLKTIQSLVASPLKNARKINHSAKSEEIEFCGSTDLNQIKNLIKEWVQKTNDPVMEDVKLLSDYLIQVLKNRDLEKLNLVIKYFYRLLKLKNVPWQKAYLDTIKNIQEEMLNCYGSQLKVNTCF